MVLQNIPTYALYMEIASCCPSQSYISPDCCWKVLATRRKVIISVTHQQTPRPTPVTYQQDLMCTSGTNGIGVTNNFLNEFKTHAMR